MHLSSYISFVLLHVCLSLWGAVVQANSLSAKITKLNEQTSNLDKVASSLLATPNISYSSMLEDINYLASEQLKGRDNFSESINEAASYIAQRFQHIGLQPLPGNEDFYQRFTVVHNKPNTISVVINQQKILTQNIAFVSNALKKSWRSPKQIQIKYISDKDNFTTSIRAYNHKGGEYLVIVSPIHRDIFKRYKTHFTNGKTQLSHPSNTSLKPSEKQQNTLILVLDESQKMDQLEIHLSTTQHFYHLKNVIGVLPPALNSRQPYKNTSNKNLTDVLLFSAHYDHLGIDHNTQKIYSGADDNASGTTAMIQLAEFYSQQENNVRPLIFTAFSAEELGTLGAIFLSTQLLPENISAMINIEMIGKTSKFGKGKLWMTGENKSDLFNLLNKSRSNNISRNNVQNKKMVIYPDPYPEQHLFYRSDNAPFARLGVPAHSFSSSQIDIDPHYHQTSDTLSTLDLTAMYQAIENLSRITQPLVQGVITPTRIEVNTQSNNGKFF